MTGKKSDQASFIITLLYLQMTVPKCILSALPVIICKYRDSHFKIFFILKFSFLWLIFNLPRPNRLYSLGFHHRTVYDQYILDLRTSADCPDRGAHPSPGWVELGEVWSADHNCQLCNTCLVFFGAFFCSANFRRKNDRNMSNHTNWQCCKPLKI